MKSKKKALVTLLLLIVGISIQAEGHTLALRTLGIFEKLTPPTIPTTQYDSRSQGLLLATNYLGAISSTAQLVIDLSHFEFMANGNIWQFPSTVGLDPISSRSLTTFRNSAAVELASYYSTLEGNYGRLGLGYLRFISGAENWINVSLSTGIMPTVQSMWSLGLYSTFLSSLSEKNSFLTLRAQSARSLGKKGGPITLGGFILWSYHIRNVPDSIQAQFDRMLFAMGPTLAISTAHGTLSLKASWQLWIDKENTVLSSKTVTRDLIEIAELPSLELGWSFRW